MMFTCSGTFTSACRCTADHVFAHGAQRTLGQAHFGSLDLVAIARGSLGDVAGADRAEELALGAGLGVDRELEFLQRRRALLGAGQVLVRHALKLGTTRLEAGDVVGGGERGLATGQQEVAAVAGTYLDAIADVAEVGNLLQENDIHLR